MIGAVGCLASSLVRAQPPSTEDGHRDVDRNANSDEESLLQEETYPSAYQEENAHPAPPPRADSETVSPDAAPPYATRRTSADPSEYVEDSLFWIEALFGYSFINLTQFDQDNFLPRSANDRGSGYTGGLGMGFRFALFTAGVHTTLSRYSALALGTVGLDLGLRIPAGLLEPYVRFGGGYVWTSRNEFDARIEQSIDISGFFGEVGGGLDFVVGAHGSVGAGLDASVMRLNRQSIRDAEELDNIALNEAGDAVGLQLRAHAHARFLF